MEDPIDVQEAIESWRVEACIRSLEGDATGADLWNRAADLFADILVRRPSGSPAEPIE